MPIAGSFLGFSRKYDFPALCFTIIAGFIAALLVVQSPLIGIGAVLGLIGFSVVIQRPEIPFGLLVFSFAIPVQKTLAGLPLNAADGIIVLWGAAWPFLMSRKRDEPFRIPFIFWAALPLIVCATLSLATAVNFGGSVKQLIRLIEWFMVLPILMTSFSLDRRFWPWLLVIFLLIPPLFALDGIVEVLNNGNSLSKMLGIPAPVPSKEFSQIRHTFDVSGRAGSTFGGAQGLAMYLTMMMSVILSIVLLPPKPIYRVLGILALIVCIGGMIYAKSRGGFLGSLVMLTVVFIVMRPRQAMMVIISGGLAVSAIFIWFLIFYGWDGTIAGLIPGRPEAVLDRLIIWGRALSIFAGSPLTGVGFGGFRDAVYQNGGINLNVGLGYESLHCHNTYLEVLTGTGILGFASYLLFLGLCFRRFIMSWINRAGLPSDCFILAAIGALSAYMMFGMVDMLFLQNMHFTLISILTLGVLAGEASRKNSKEESV